MKRALLVLAMAFGSFTAEADDLPSAIAHELSQKFVTACEAGKVDEALALYLDDAVVVFPSEGAAARGKADVAKLLAQNCGPDTGKSKWLGGTGAWLGEGQLVIVANGAWETSGQDAQGKTVSVTIRTTEVLVKTPDGWKYRLDHASVGVPPPEPTPAP
jgi:ketosteroid isomerase-like protein